jgi:hypothetical protein
MKKPISMRVFLPKGRQFLINPETERVFQVRQLKSVRLVNSTAGGASEFGSLSFGLPRRRA